MTRALLMAACLVLAAGCGGGGSSGAAATAPSGLLCDSNSQGMELARPSPAQTGVQITTSTIEIVDDGDLDQLYSLTPQFDLTLVSSAGGKDATTSLVEVQDPTGPHPYGASSYFFEGTLTQGLTAGVTYTVSLAATTSSCTPLLVGTFST
jgi:hypothetical protein